MYVKYIQIEEIVYGENTGKEALKAVMLIS